MMKGRHEQDESVRIGEGSVPNGFLRQLKQMPEALTLIFLHV